LFYEPLAVFFNNEVLSTLPLREMVSGKAEMFKHGLIAEAPLFEAMHLLAANDLPPAEWIKLAVEIKCNIVAADPTEQNERELLNFGHTLGHAIESHSHHQGQPLLHGEAIFIGMLLESRLSTALNLLSPEHLATIEKCLAAYQPAYVVPPLAELMPWLVHDKKNRAAQIKFSLLTGIGEAIYGKGLTAEALLALQTKLY
jgi:3-dehydroquinate synthase